MSGYSAYQKNLNVVENPRAVEYRLLGQVTAALLDAGKNLNDKPKLIGAILWNKNVWDHFLIEVQDDANRLPKDLRVKITNIGIWVNKETSRVMDGESNVDGLVEINQIIMEGLK